VVAEASWLLFAANFNLGFLWSSDAQVPYTFLRRLFGAQVNAVGYQFGLAFFEDIDPVRDGLPLIRRGGEATRTCAPL
jgi:hypothetical protein